MRIQLPNKVILDVAEGVDPQWAANHYMDSIREKNRANQDADLENANPTKDMGTLERLAVGNTMGWARPIRGALDVVGIKTDKLGSSDTDEALHNTTAGAVGDFIGNTAALTGPTLVAGLPLAAAGRALPAASRLASTLTGPAAQMALGGSLGGALNAEHGGRTEGAALGGGLALATMGLLKGANKVAVKGISKYSPEFQELRDVYIKNLFAPLSRSAREGWTKKFMGLIAQTPAASTRMAAQEVGGQAAVRKVSGEIGAPQTALDELQNAGIKIPSIIDDPHDWRATIDKGIKMVFGKVNTKKLAIASTRASGASTNWGQNVLQTVDRIPDPQVRYEVKTLLDELINRPRLAGETEITGERFLKVYKALNTMKYESGALQGPTGRYIQSVMDGMKAMTRRYPNAKDWDNVYKLLDDEFSDWSVVEASIARAANEGGKFTPGQLLKSSISSSGRSTIASGAAPMQRFAQLAKAGVGEGVGRGPGAFQANVETGLPVSKLVTNALLSPVGFVLRNENVQRSLVGDLASQKALAQMLKNNPELIRALLTAETAAATPEGD